VLKHLTAAYLMTSCNSITGAPGQCHQISAEPNLFPDNLVGQIPEISCEINGKKCISLIDTGSQVTTLSYSFFQQHFPDVNLIDCSQLLRVEGAGGNRLPYHGYVDVNLTFPLNDTQSISRDIPVLIVQDTKYNATVPLLIGTNFLGKIPGDSNISLASCSSAVKMAVAVLQVRAELLDRSDGVLGKVFAATDMVVSRILVS